MDRELRDLERKALQGDQNAHYRLLIRLHALGDFDLNDLHVEVRRQLALMLSKSLPNDDYRVRVYTESDPNFYPEYRDPFICPREGCNSLPTQFTYHELIWAGYACDIRLEGPDEFRLPVNVDYTSGEQTVVDVHLYCSVCQANWRVDAEDVEGM